MDGCAGLGYQYLCYPCQVLGTCERTVRAGLALSTYGDEQSPYVTGTVSNTSENSCLPTNRKGRSARPLTARESEGRR